MSSAKAKLTKIINSQKTKQLIIMAILLYACFMLTGGPAYLTYLTQGPNSLHLFDNPKSIAVTGFAFITLFIATCGMLIIAQAAEGNQKMLKKTPIGWGLIFLWDIIMLIMMVLWNNGTPIPF